MDSPAKWASEAFLELKAPGFDIISCHMHLAHLSIRCEELVLYRKALRVKIRMLIKEGKSEALDACMDTLFRLAQFVRHLYGHHSCDSAVAPWQEQVARSLQKELDTPFSDYKRGSWLEYERLEKYAREHREKYFSLGRQHEDQEIESIQDGHSFLNPKDRTHLERWHRANI